MPSATEVRRHWRETLARVEAGEIVEITRYGRPVAVIRRPEREITGKEAAAIFARVRPDPEAADAVAAELAAYREAASQPGAR